MLPGAHTVEACQEDELVRCNSEKKKIIALLQYFEPTSSIGAEGVELSRANKGFD